MDNQVEVSNDPNKTFNDYADLLNNFSSISKTDITELTIKAQNYGFHSEAVVEAIETQMKQAHSSQKLAFLYLIDSIVKNHGDLFVGPFLKNIGPVFLDAFRTVEHEVRQKFIKVLDTWRSGRIFPQEVLQQLGRELEAEGGIGTASINSFSNNLNDSSNGVTKRQLVTIDNSFEPLKNQKNQSTAKINSLALSQPDWIKLSHQSNGSKNSYNFASKFNKEIPRHQNSPGYNAHNYNPNFDRPSFIEANPKLFFDRPNFNSGRPRPFNKNFVSRNDSGFRPQIQNFNGNSNFRSNFNGQPNVCFQRPRPYVNMHLGSPFQKNFPESMSIGNNIPLDIQHQGLQQQNHTFFQNHFSPRGLPKFPPPPFIPATKESSATNSDLALVQKLINSGLIPQNNPVISSSAGALNTTLSSATSFQKQAIVSSTISNNGPQSSLSYLNSDGIPPPTLATPIKLEINSSSLTVKKEAGLPKNALIAPTVKVIFRLNQKDINIVHVGAEESLYANLPLTCNKCGLRFPSTSEGQSFHTAHMDWHFNRNRIRSNKPLIGSALNNISITQALSTKIPTTSRIWYPSIQDWILKQDTEYSYQSEPAFFSSANRNEEVKGGNNEMFQAIAELEKSSVVLPQDHVEKPCPLCKDKFVSLWSEDEDEWIYKNAIMVNGEIYHATCRANNNSKHESEVPKDLK